MNGTSLAKARDARRQREAMKDRHLNVSTRILTRGLFVVRCKMRNFGIALRCQQSGQ